MTTSTVTIEDRLAELERLIDELRRQQGTYRPRKPVALTAADAYAAAVTR